MSSKENSVLVVVVIYHLTDVYNFKRRLGELLNYGSVLIVDNGGNDEVLFPVHGDLFIHCNSGNIGTCSVIFDIRIKEYFRSYSHILFLDQDTELTSYGYFSLSKLVAYDWGYMSLRNYGLKSFWNILFSMPKYQFSGSFFSTALLDELSNTIGNLVFLDYCDWLIYWHLLNKKYSPKMIKNCIGEHVFGNGGRGLFKHSAGRTYIQVKNSNILLRMVQVPLRLKIFLVFRLFFLFLIIPMMNESKTRYASFIAGLRDKNKT